MNSSDYNRYYHAIMNANDIRDDDVCRKVLRGIYNDMCAEYGPTNDDVKHLFGLFRLYI